MSNSGSILNLLVLGIAIILLLVVIWKNKDTFEGKMPMVSVGSGGYIPYMVPGQVANGYPLLYQNQLYPAKIPYINDSVKNVGRPCGEGNSDCGVFGSCVNGVCSINKAGDDTVFNLKL